MLRTFSILLSLPLSSCSLVTTPAKVVGKAATTTIDVSGKALGAGIGTLNGSDEKE